MVWNASQSPLYKAVEIHNAAAGRPDDPAPSNPPREAAAMPAETPRCPAPRQNEPPGLLRDKDSLLLIALIFILAQNKADIRLIAALAFVLLG